MNRHLFLSLLLALFASSTLSADNLRIEPTFWWSGMKNPELQLMVYGEGIGNAAVSVNYPGVSLRSTVMMESNNYLLVYLKLDKDVKPGKFNLITPLHRCPCIVTALCVNGLHDFIL